MNELTILHEHLDDAIKQLKKQLDRVDHRQYFISENLLIKAIQDIDNLTVSLRKQAFN